MEWFVCQDSSLTGTLPTELGLLTKMSVLAWYENPLLTGPIPSELGLLPSLDGALALTYNVSVLTIFLPLLCLLCLQC